MEILKCLVSTPMVMALVIIHLALLIAVPSSLDTKDVVVVILTQSNEHHLKLAENLRAKLYKQAEYLRKPHPVVHFSHQDFPHPGGWAILPILQPLYDLHKENSSWIFFIEDRTEINLDQLLIILSNYNAGDELFLGHALHDEQATIIHHFAFYDDVKSFVYPNIASGFALTTKLLNRLCERLRQGDFKLNFSIDSSHELALFIWDKGNGRKLQHEPKLCIEKQPYCATYSVPYLRHCIHRREPPNKSIYFAVKTCQQFHQDRVEVVKSTWGRYAQRIKYFSDVRDDSIPTIKLNVPHVTQGYCAKTIGILHYVNAEMRIDAKIQWLVIADDDTILGISKLRKLLSCYDSSKPIALGQRYGFNLHTLQGYNYITGGGGMIFSRPLVKLLSESEFCRCPTPDTPDDMFLGLCLTKLQVDITHSPLFHQARPSDYAVGYLSNDKEAVSFHKHWMMDPVDVYNEWFGEEDLKLVDSPHDEL